VGLTDIGFNKGNFEADDSYLQSLEFLKEDNRYKMQRRYLEMDVSITISYPVSKTDSTKTK
jgi:hypothetical protein